MRLTHPLSQAISNTRPDRYIVTNCTDFPSDLAVNGGQGAEFFMSSNSNHSSALPDADDVQNALFALRDSLMNLKMSLLELAASSDPHMQQMAQEATDELLARLRP